MRARICRGCLTATVIMASAQSLGIFDASAQSFPDSPPWGSVRASTRQAADGPVRQAQRWASVPAAGNSGVQPEVPTVMPLPQSGSAAVSAVVVRPGQPSPGSAARSRSPSPRGRRIVPFSAAYPPGSIVIANSERVLYLVGNDGKATRYPVAIGTMGEAWTGVEFVTDKKVNPWWYPVQEPGKERREPVAGGDPANPLGARALYLGRTLWRIHGTPASESIGHAASAGCIRMHNEHVIELYDQVMLGTEVYVVERIADPLPSHRGRKLVME